MNKQLLLMEYARCKMNPVYFIKTYIKIRDSQTSEILPFDLWDFQEDFIDSYKTYRMQLVLKSRQLGMSTVTLALLLHELMFKPQSKIAYICKKENDAAFQLEEMRFMIEQLPDWLRPKIEPSRTVIRFKASNSFIIALPASPQAARQHQFSHIVLDEYAFLNEIQGNLDQKIYTAALPSFQRKGRCTIISTPNGTANRFADMCTSAKGNKLPKWGFHELSWRLREERLYNSEGIFDDGLEFKQSVLDQPGGERIWNAEYDCKFLGSGSNVFNIDSLILSTTPKEPIKNHVYVIGGDIGGGDTSGDPSVAQVIDIFTGEQVFTWRGHVSPKEFGNVLYEIGRRYNDALIAPERNSFGQSTIDQLEHRAYKNIYKHTDSKLGFPTTSSTKPEIIFDLDSALRFNVIKLSDSQTLTELQQYEYKSSSTRRSQMGAPNGQHDDTVMALSIAFYLMNKGMHNTAKTYGRAVASRMGL